MSISLWRAVGLGVALLVVIGSGFWLSHAGKPYGVGLLTVHKLIGLAGAVLLLMGLHATYRTGGLASTTLIVGLVTGLLFLVTGVVGALLTLEKPMPAALPTVHQVAAYLTTLSAGASIYLLLVRR